MDRTWTAVVHTLRTSSSFVKQLVRVGNLDMYASQSNGLAMQASLMHAATCYVWHLQVNIVMWHQRTYGLVFLLD
jgi:hypothetical protein